MEDVAHAGLQTTHKQTVFTNELLSAFEDYAKHIKLLSLDCFDTLLWRKAATPLDVFYDLQQRPAFKKLGITAIMRAEAERHARDEKIVRCYSNEVTLAEIYQHDFPNLDEQTIAQLEEEELLTEIDACYAFMPVVDLIRSAYAKNIPVIIVSDTYLKSDQLKRLLAAHLPADVLPMIKKIFCSCDYGKSKTLGIFKLICTELQIQPEVILHVGDNPVADAIVPRQERMHALHFIQHSDRIKDLFRMQAVAATLLDSSHRDQRSLANPYKGFFAVQTMTDTPEEIVGYASLGQIMYPFAKFLITEVAEIKKSRPNVKVAFLMRDAYLPYLVCEALLNEPLGKRVQISRFASYAATFRTQKDIDQYVIANIATERFDVMLRQLLIPDEIAQPIIIAAKTAANRQKKFAELIHQPDILNIIFTKSKEYYTRLKCFLEKEIGLTRGDTLILIDLGYSGTTQKLLGPVLKDDMQVEVLGRYLISLSVPGWNTQARNGLMDTSWCDSRCLYGFVNYIALLEQLCTSNEKHAADYDLEGNPIYIENGLSNQQYAKRDLIQAACLRFARDAENFFQKTNIANNRLLREAAFAELGRLLFFPSQSEITYLESFEFELNLGTEDVLHIFDREKGLANLRKQGVFFSQMAKHGLDMRTNVPAELRTAGLELAMTFFAFHRFALQVQAQDISIRNEKIDLIVIRNNQTMQMTLEAVPTFDGYYALNIPIGDGSFQVGVLFGRKYIWLQFAAVERIFAPAFFKETESLYTEDYWDKIIFSQMTTHEQKLYECHSSESLLMIPADPNPSEQKKHVMRIAFRPIAKR